MKQTVVREVDVPQSFRVAQVASMFDVPLAAKLRHEWEVELPLEDRPRWQLGLIVGPSGCGKSSIARALWPAAYVREFAWPADRAILDAFPPGVSVQDVTGALTSVGFSSPPEWVKPYSALSTGQQMRADLARALCLPDRLVVFDEFTSVVDRTVAQIGSAALAKAVRRDPGRQFVAVTCHADVLPWLTPDWTYEPATGTFDWRSLRRPPIELSVARVHRKAWAAFRQHHYLSAQLNPSAVCYCAYWRDDPVAFVAVLPMVGFSGYYRLSRTVVLPDYQGVGIGSYVSDAIAAYYWAQGKVMRATATHPALIAHRNRSPRWRLARQIKYGSMPHAGQMAGIAFARFRSCATFEYVGEGAGEGAPPEEAPRHAAARTPHADVDRGGARPSARADGDGRGRRRAPARAAGSAGRRAKPPERGPRGPQAVVARLNRR